MKNCLNCNAEFQEKRDAAKYCSDKCRVMYNRKHPKDRVTKTQMQVLYNEVMGLIEKAKSEPHQQFFGVATKDGIKWGETTPDPVGVVLKLPYGQAKILISQATSAHELENTWRQIIAQEWPKWQMNELIKEKETQRTKIDF